MGGKLLIATNNQGKVREFRELLRATGRELVTLEEAGIKSVAAETGQTFEENARIKATAYARESGLLTLADDSGLEVAALGGEPGVKSARYAGEKASDSDRVKLLLANLAQVPQDKRTARFHCVIAVATPAGEAAVCEGECQGYITFEPKGSNGFGYDPVFLFTEFNKTMAELSPEMKGQVSHRARAAAKVQAILNKPPFTSG